MQRNYNFIYKELVQNEYDIVGHISYALYKKDKIAHIEAYKNKHLKEPLDQELIPFNEFSSSPSSIESYRLKAEIILQGFLDNVLDETVNEIEENTKKGHSAILKEIITPLLPPTKTKQFFFGVGQSIVASFAVILIFTLLIVIFQMRNSGPQDVIEKAFNVKITPNSTQFNDSISLSK